MSCRPRTGQDISGKYFDHYSHFRRGRGITANPRESPKLGSRVCLPSLSHHLRDIIMRLMSLILASLLVCGLTLGCSSHSAPGAKPAVQVAQAQVVPAPGAGEAAAPPIARKIIYTSQIDIVVENITATQQRLCELIEPFVNRVDIWLIRKLPAQPVHIVEVPGRSESLWLSSTDLWPSWRNWENSNAVRVMLKM